jgi:pyridoxamine 5'-phosphate oxidase
VPCPDDWGAVRLRPDRIELWQEGEDCLHGRRLFEAGADGWRQSLLAP